MQSLFLEPSPAPAKALLNLMGRTHNVLRLPLVPVSASVRQKLEDLASELASSNELLAIKNLHMV